MYLADYRAATTWLGVQTGMARRWLSWGRAWVVSKVFASQASTRKLRTSSLTSPRAATRTDHFIGRASGYPNWPSDNPKVMKTALYFDAVNFASESSDHLVSMGFTDTTTPPVGIWIAFNQIQGPKEAVPMIESPHNHLATPAQQRPYTTRSAEWLNTLVQGGEIKPNQELTRLSSTGQDIGGSGSQARAGDQPIPRTDQNSQIAHADLWRRPGRVVLTSISQVIPSQGDGYQR